MKSLTGQITWLYMLHHRIQVANSQTYVRHKRIVAIDDWIGYGKMKR